MEPHSLPQNTLQLQTATDGYLHTTIPWWGDISAEVRRELHLDSQETLHSRRVDIVVIGGGVAGLSAALGARAIGADTLLLEATPGLGRGATGRNAGILSTGVNMGVADLDPHGPEARFWPETTIVLLDLVKVSQAKHSLLQAQLTGSLNLAESAHAARQLAREVQARIALGTRAELWTAEEVTEYTDGRLNASKVVSAMWLPEEGRIQPLTLLAHLARLAREMGVTMIGGAHVAAYLEQTGPGTTAHWQITLNNGSIIESEGLICATGPTARPNAHIYALSFAANLPDTFPLFWDAAPYSYADYRPGQGRLTVSGGRYARAGGSKHPEKYYQHLIDSARYWLPELNDQQPIYQWGVDLDVTADMVPNLRELGENAPGLAIEGLGALGVLPGIVLGQRGGDLLARSLGGELTRATQEHIA